MATGKEQFAALLDKQDFQMITSFKQTYIDALKHYYFVGGMPEAVQSFTENKDFNEVREIQKRILAAYTNRISPNTLPMRSFQDCVCYGIVSLSVGKRKQKVYIRPRA